MGWQLKLIDRDWERAFGESVSKEHRDLQIICPFLQRRVVERLLRNGRPDSLRVVTRFCLSDFYQGVSSTEALRVLLTKGASIRGVKNLHAKMYIFGDKRVIVTSANLTDAALRTNHEVGFLSDDPDTVTRCRESFSELWARAGEDLTVDRLTGWEQKIRDALATNPNVSCSFNLPDEGCDFGNSSAMEQSSLFVPDSEQAFVKFWGESTNRVHLNYSVLDEVKNAGCHWACTYPKGKRPRQVETGAVIYMGRLVSEPNDTRIFGRAIALEHEQGRDDATANEIEARSWKSQWPHYVRVHHAEFIDGTMADGISFAEMMDALGSDSFEITQKHARAGAGNMDPRKAYRQKPAVLLTQQGAKWIEQRLQRAFNKLGSISSSRLSQLDWPNATKVRLGAID